MGRSKRRVGAGLLACAALLGVAACGSGGGGSSDIGSGTHASTVPGGKAAASAKPKAKPSPTHPSGPPMLLETITPAKGAKVGVAMPISVVFSKPVAQSARAKVEKHLLVTTSAPVTGAWHWFGGTRVDWRPKDYWPTGTRVTVDAKMTDVPDGNGRYGIHDYIHNFTVGDAVETKISVPGHSLKVYRDGKLIRTMPIDAGSPSFPSWDGTMAVIDKQAKVRMKSCSVGIACKKSDPNYYDMTLPWDVHLTYSGTYVHYSSGDPQPGHSYGSHGCVHLSLANSKWYYDLVKQGDPITITGSPRGKAAPDNGYASFNLSWDQWKAGSALPQT